MGVVKGGSQDLAAWQILPGGGDAPFLAHAVGFKGQACGKAGQRCAVGAQKEDGFLQIACGLLDGKGCEPWAVEAGLGHDPVYCEFELMAYLIKADFRDEGRAPALFVQKRVGCCYGLFSALHGNIHGILSRVFRLG